MARLKLLDSISELKVKGDVHPLRTAIQERVGRPLRSTVKPLNEQVSDIIRQIEIEEGAELSTMLPYEDLLSIREEIIPEVIGGSRNPMDNFESQFQSMFGKPKKAAGGVVSLYNRPGYGLGGDIWNTITGSKIGDVAKWGYNQFTGEGRKKEEEKYKRWVNKPLVYPQMTKEQFDAYQGEDYLNKLLEMESEMIPKSSVIDTRPGSSTGYEQIYSDINELMTNMPPTERGEAEVENFVDTFGPDQRYQFHYVDPDPEIGGMPLSAEQYYEYQQDPEKRMNTYIIDQMGPIHNYLEIGNKELERKYQNFEITENKYAEELNKLDNAAKKIDKRNKELSEQLENGEITQNEFDIQMGQQAENLRSIQDFLPSYEMEGPMASVYQPYNPLAQDPNHPLYKYEMATRFGTNQDLGYEKYPGSEGYGDRYSEDLLRLGGNTAAQFAHFLLGEGINLSFALTPTTSFREGKMPEFWAEEVRKQGGNPEGLLEKFIGTDPYKVKGLYDWMRTWNPNWAVGAGGAADMLSGLGGWFFNKDWNPNFTEMLKDKDWRIFGDHALSKYLPFLKERDKKVVSISEHEAAELGVEPGTYLPSVEDPSKPDFTKRISHGLFDPHGGVQSMYDLAAEKFGWEPRDMRDYQYKDPFDYQTTGVSPNTRYGDTGVGSYQWLHPGQGYQDWIDPEYYDEYGRGRTFETPVIDWMGTSQVGPMAFFAKDIPRMLSKLSPTRLIKTKSGTFNIAQMNKDLERYLKYQKAGVKPPGRLKRLYEAVTRAGTGRKTTDEFVDELVKAIDADAAEVKKIEPPKKKKKKKKKKSDYEKLQEKNLAEGKPQFLAHDPDYIGNAHGGMVDVRDMTGAL